jgi:hypothetical protein
MGKPDGRVSLIIKVEKERYTKLPFEHTAEGPLNKALNK